MNKNKSCLLILVGIVYGPLLGMTGAEHRISQVREAARSQAEMAARDAGKSPEEIKQAGRTAANEAGAQAQAREKFSQNAQVYRKQLAEEQKLKKEEEKEEEKEPENPISVQTPAVPEKQEQLADSRQARNWAARYEDQMEQTFRMPVRFDDGPALRFGDYMVAWDQEQRRNRVLLCSSVTEGGLATQCKLETEDTIYIYRLEGTQWVLHETLDK